MIALSEIPVRKKVVQIARDNDVFVVSCRHDGANFEFAARSLNWLRFEDHDVFAIETVDCVTGEDTGQVDFLVSYEDRLLLNGVQRCSLRYERS
jgi:hypothetical protein